MGCGVKRGNPTGLIEKELVNGRFFQLFIVALVFGEPFHDVTVLYNGKFTVEILQTKGTTVGYLLGKESP